MKLLSEETVMTVASAIWFGAELTVANLFNIKLLVLKFVNSNESKTHWLVQYQAVESGTMLITPVYAQL